MPSGTVITAITSNIMVTEATSTIRRTPWATRSNASIVLVLGLACTVYLIGQLHVFLGENHVRQRSYRAALDQFERAAKLLPFDAEVQQQLGRTYLNLAVSVPYFVPRVILSKAEAHLNKASELSPREPSIAINLAQTLYFQGIASPKEIISSYEHAINLWPTSHDYYEVYIDTLIAFGKEDKANAAVTKLAEIFPSSYFALHRKEYWTDTLSSSFKKGLERALNTGTDPINAHRALGHISADQGNYQQAVAHYQSVLAIGKRKTTSRDYLSLGEYHLLSKDPEAAYTAFMTGLSQNSAIEGKLKRLVSIYSQAAELDSFPAFYNQAKGPLGLSYKEDIVVAERLITYQSFEFAEQLLLGVVEEKSYLAEPWFLLAKIHRGRDNVQAMKVALSKGNARKRNKN